ncbi:MAG: hypothetical protein Kow0047_27270 [Anaerolineae bacterium]
MGRALARATFLTRIVSAAILASPNWRKQATKGRSIYVVFRYDDYCDRTSTELEVRLIQAFRRVKASATFSVIPFVCAVSAHDPSPQELIPLSEAKARFLKEAVQDGTLEIALHGYSHQTSGTGRFTEVAGLAFEEQVERLQKGKQFLEGLTEAVVSTFVPPWNDYDHNTLHAMRHVGLSILSASWSGAMPEDHTTALLPATSDLRTIRQAIFAARASREEQPIIVVLFHAYDFKEVDSKRGITTYEEFVDMLDWLKSQDDIKLTSIYEVSTLDHALHMRRFAEGKRINRLFY